ncbi:L,D-peptidoglycan transpeptidase YkuD, ErfK/YbiS/YcfS/YnhG family [Filomicrobium insigne]|uniref:L,D-peptidoglycan transpeptidase YkuD, ErfK/YbiS/YcfS/YnhG family n=1 Tax=Filomicrobium insigne TaxID=418854 RepID=A0A1H0JEG8_9HYPH|nr:L,D-transpeptidase family protein [Filomicrobium sp.]SDO41923.1 L,D-peptidoglycan transpeptidase YkuD, ErfK/YbiS/YcfS/YnhG family [Filomicrobium insigne]
MNVKNAHAAVGVVQFDSRQFPCALGRSGLSSIKMEGDGATPIGRWALRRAYYRADRIQRPITGLPLQAIRPTDGWCDAPCDPNYNRPVSHPYRASAERLWRHDHLYDLIIVVGYNDVQRSRRRGSAIFIHVATPDFAPTEGCIALRRNDLIQLVGMMRPGQDLHIGPYHWR